MNSEVIILIKRFISGMDTSIEIANEIEVALDDNFPNDDYVQQTVEMLAMYRPGGGVFLFDYDIIRQRLLKTINHINKKKSCPDPQSDEG